MADRHEQLPELDGTPVKRSARLPDVKVDEDILDEHWSPSQQFPKPKQPISQWKLLKMIKQEKGMALSDLCWIFQLDDREDDKIRLPLEQLLRGNKIKRIIGSSKRTHQTGNFYLPVDI